MEVSTVDIKTKIKNTLLGRNTILDEIEEAITFRTRNHKSFLYHIYGVGGIGKSSLKKVLKNRFESAGLRPVELNFANENNRMMDRALNQLRSELTKAEGFIFPSYDFARVVYWKKKDPDAPITNNPDLSFLEEGDFTANLIKDLMEDAKDVPILGWIPKGANFVLKYSSILRDWWHTKGKKTLKDLDQMDFEDIGDLLLDYWIEDVKYNLKKKRSSVLMIMLDTFEALWEEEGKFFRNKGAENWIYQLMKQLPETVFISIGRNPLAPMEEDSVIVYKDWELLPFGDGEMRAYLNAFEIEDEAIQNQVMQVTMGIPLYLSLEVQNILFERYEMPHARVSNSLEEVVKRFLKYKSPQEEHLLKILSIPNRITLDLCHAVFGALNYNLTDDEKRELLSDTFIEKEGDYYFLHDLIRERFARQLEHDPVQQKVHIALFNYFKKEIADGQSGNSLEEMVLDALYHGRFALPVQEYSEWFVKMVHHVQHSLPQAFIVPMFLRYIDSLKEMGAKEFDVAHAYYLLGKHHLSSGRLFFKEAKMALLKAEEELLGAIQDEVYDEAYIFLNTELSKVIGQVCMLLHEDGLAKESYRRVLAFYDQFTFEEDPGMYDVYAGDLLDVAQFFVYKGDQKQAKEIFERIDVEKCTSISLLESLGSYFNASGSYQEAKDVFLKAVELENADSTDIYEQRDQLRVLHYNLGCAYENLKEWDDAVDCFKDGLTYVREDSIQQQFCFIDGIAKVYKARKLYEDSLSYYEILMAKKLEYYPANHEEIWLTKAEQAFVQLLKAKKMDVDDPLIKAFKDTVETLLDIPSQSPFMANYLDSYLPMVDHEWKKLIEAKNHKSACLLLVDLLQRLRKYYQEDNEKIMEIKMALGNTYALRGKAFYTRAEQCFYDVLEWYQSQAARSHGYAAVIKALTKLYQHADNKSGLAKLNRMLARGHRL